MTATRTTKKTTAPKKPTTPQQWKKGSAEPVELPSGNVMKLRKMSMSTLIATGKMPNSLMSMMQSAVDKGTGMTGVEKQLSEMMADEKKMLEMSQFLDRLVIMVAQEPTVSPAPATESDRSPDELYIDEVDEEDKSFIFQLVTGGTADVEQFRQGHSAGLASLSGLQNVELPAVGTTPAG